MKRPLGVTVLAIFALIAAFVAFLHTLQMLNPFSLFGGSFGFFGINIMGAILWGIMALIYLWVFRMLWSLDQQGWLFISVLSALSLLLAFISIFGQTTWMEMLPSIIINGIILIYSQLPGTKAAFSVPAK